MPYEIYEVEKEYEFHVEGVGPVIRGRILY